MGQCKYCNQPAGFLRSKHAACEVKYELGRQQIIHSISRAVGWPYEPTSIQNFLNERADQSHISSSERHALFLEGWTKAVDTCLEDGVLSDDEEESLLQLPERLSLSVSELEGSEAYGRVAKAAVLRDVLSGKLPNRQVNTAELPLNFQKGEHIVWAFPSVKYLEDKTRRQYVGGSQGASFRIMKGVYYRVGAFKGEAVEHTERVHVDTGWVVVTSRHVYFAGPIKSFRVPYSKIVSFQPFSNGVGIVRDAANAKPQLFVTGDGWFTYNLVTNLAQL